MEKVHLGSSELVVSRLCYGTEPFAIKKGPDDMKSQGDLTPRARAAAIRSLKEAGRGVYVIKLLNAGRLRDEADSAIRFALQFHEFIDVWNIGMYDLVDVNRNLELFREVLGS